MVTNTANDCIHFALNTTNKRKPRKPRPQTTATNHGHIYFEGHVFIMLIEVSGCKLGLVHVCVIVMLFSFNF
jgi:hypothetical protein